MFSKEGLETILAFEIRERLIPKIAIRYDKTSRVKLNAELKSSLIEKLGVKLNPKSEARAAAIAVERAGARSAALAESSAAGPEVTIAELAFGVVTGALDGMNLGGFKNLETMTALNSTRDTLNKNFVDSLNGTDLPMVMGPLDKMTGQDLAKKIVDVTVSLVRANPLGANPTDAQLNDIVDRAYARVCTDNGGFMYTNNTTGNTYCSFSQTNCKAPWPMENTDTYYEWKDNVCQATQSAMRSYCESMGNGVTYNMDTGSCNLTNAYCGRYTGRALMSNGDCIMNDGQKFAEAIFGTAFTRSILNIFDFKDNYNACPPGTTEPNELNALDAFPGLGLAAAGALAIGAQFFCSGAQCPAGQEMMLQTLGVNKSLGGLCYEACRPGYTSNWSNDRSSAIAGMCYGPCPPGYQGSAATCTTFNQPCNDPGFGVQQGGICYSNSVKRLAGGAVATTIPKTLMACSPSEHDDGASCWGYKHTWIWGLVNCVENHAHCILGPETWQITKNLGDRELGGTCPDGYQSLSPTDATCQAVTRPLSGVVPRDSYSRPPLQAAYSVFHKTRKTAFPSTSDDDFKNSAIGQYVQAGINSARNGDPAGFGKALGGLLLTSNPAVLSLGMSDLAAMQYNKVTS